MFCLSGIGWTETGVDNRKVWRKVFRTATYGNLQKEKLSSSDIPPGGLRRGERCCIMGTLITDFNKEESHEPYTGASKEE